MISHPHLGKAFLTELVILEGRRSAYMRAAEAELKGKKKFDRPLQPVALEDRKDELNIIPMSLCVRT